MGSKPHQPDTLDFDRGARGHHTTGLGGLEDRMSALGGRLLLESPPGKGTRVCAQLPVSGPSGEIPDPPRSIKKRPERGFPKCAREDSNLHGPISPQGPQPWTGRVDASTGV